jgi:6-phosphogluconate dehydrogenase
MTSVGMVGLGRMGANMALRLQAAGHEVVGYDPHSKDADVHSLAELVERLPAPRIVWVMVPAGAATSGVVTELGGLLSSGDLVVDGGNSRWTDDAPRAAALGEHGIGYCDCGVSGGVWGRTEGYGLMVGGAAEHVAQLQPVLDALRPQVPPGEDPRGGFVHAGPVGAGHFTKMVHNGVEYGLMQAYAEGYELLAASPDLVPDPAAVVAAWTRGTVVRSWLLDLLVRALDDDPGLVDIAGVAADSGEGRWTLEAGIDRAVPLPVIAAALFARFSSRQDDSPAMKAVAALRQQFGGHAVTASSDPPRPAAGASGASGVVPDVPA